MLNKVDLQLFRSSLRVISAELKALPPGYSIPKRVFEELSCMEFVIKRSEGGDVGKLWGGGVPSPRSR